MSQTHVTVGNSLVQRTLYRRAGTLCLLLLALYLSGCGPGAGQESLQTPTPLPTPVVPEQPRYTVVRGRVVKALTFTARISHVTERELFFRADGFVSDVYVALGDVVGEGQLLAELDLSRLEAQLAQAELALERAETILAKAEAEQASALREAQLELEQAQAQLQQAQAGAATAAVTASEINLARAEEQLAYWQEEYAKAQDRPWESQDSLDNYAFQVHQAEQNVQVAQAEYDAARSQRNAGYQNVQLRQIDVQLAELAVGALETGVDPLLALDVEKARLEVAELEAQIANAQLAAPFRGRVTSLAVQAGDAVTAYDGVALLADPSDLEVTAELGTEALAEISVGMTATIQLRSRPGEPLGGTVRQLPAGVGSSLAEDEDTRLHIAFAGEPEDVESGELATVTIMIEARDDVLWLPPAALRTFQGRDFVVVETSEGRRRVDVQLGIESEERVEIVQGVSEGQTVIGE